MNTCKLRNAKADQFVVFYKIRANDFNGATNKSHIVDVYFNGDIMLITR